jgi:mandelate racemase
MNNEKAARCVVERVVARSVMVPLEYPVKTSVGTVAASPLVLIDLHLSNGIIGHSYVFTYTPLALESTRTLVASLGAVLCGLELAPFEFDQMLARRLRLIGRSGIAMMACAGLDMAAWDALAKVHELPLAVLLGGTVKPIPAYDSHSMDGETVGLLRAGRAADEGFKAIKIKIGYEDLREDCHIVETIKKCVGDGVELMVDYNQSLSVPEAMRRIQTLQSYGLSWVEEPTLQENYAGHARIRERVSTPIQMGENWCGVEEMQRALDAGACDLAMPDVMKIGGVTGWLKAAALAEMRGIPMSSHIFQEISAHLLAVTPTAHWLERMDLAGPILARPLVFQDGAACIDETPGTGVSWDEDAIARFSE